MKADLSKIQLCFVGCGVMAEAIIAGLLRKNLVVAQQIVASHPKENRRVELQEKYAIRTFAKNIDAVKHFEKPTVFLCVKPQRIKLIFEDLKTAIAPDGLVVSIIAGVKIATISEALGSRKVIRAMPNTPAQIGAGITAWTCSPDVEEEEKLQVKFLLTALGKELYVETENMIDMATSLSATGPTYIFLVMEALTDAGVHLGFSREVAKELVQEMMLGSVLFAMESHKHPAELRNMVTSPGGTSAEAIYQMEKGGLRTVLSKAVYAAYKRAVELGEKR